MPENVAPALILGLVCSTPLPKAAPGRLVAFSPLLIAGPLAFSLASLHALNALCQNSQSCGIHAPLCSDLDACSALVERSAISECQRPHGRAGHRAQRHGCRLHIDKAAGDNQMHNLRKWLVRYCQKAKSIVRDNDDMARDGTGRRDARPRSGSCA